MEPVPQNLRYEILDDDDLEDDDFAEIPKLDGWRVERRFYTKKDGTVMLYWNYRNRKPIYINGERKVRYRSGGKKVWQKPSKPKKSGR